MCEHVWDPLSKIYKIGFDSKLPCTPATDMTTIVLNKPQTISPTTMQLTFLVPPEMWYFSGKGMIPKISQRILRGNRRRHNDLVLVQFRAMITSYLPLDFFAYHQRTKSFPCYSLLKENILLSNFWTRMMFVHSILNVVLSIKVCWKCSAGLEIFLDKAKVLLPHVLGTLELPSFADVCVVLLNNCRGSQVCPAGTTWAWNHMFWMQPPPFEDQQGQHVISSH